MTETTIRELLNALSRDPAARAEFEADPDGYFSTHGFDLPAELLGEAIVNVAATLPPETAEHLAPFTISQSPIPPIDEASGSADVPDGAPGAGGMGVAAGLGLFASAPTAAEAVTQTDEDRDETGLDGFGAGSPEGADPGDVAHTADDMEWSSDDEGALDVTAPDTGALDIIDDEEGTGLFDADARGESPDGGDDISIESRDPADLDDLDGFE